MLRYLTNMFLQNDIINKDFKIPSEHLRTGNIEDINRDTWKLLADHLERKIKRKRGPKFDIATNERNRITWVEFILLTEKNIHMMVLSQSLLQLRP